MKTITKSLLIATIIVTAGAATSWARQGTEVVHFSVHVPMTNDAVEPTASGSVQGIVAAQGNADIETLDLMTKGLTPDTSYSVMATTTSGTTQLETFTTDAKGSANLRFSNTGAKKSTQFPPGFGSLLALTEVDVVNTGSQAVLTATRDQTTQFKYLVKKSTSTNGVSGTLQLTASNKSQKFSLSATGLAASTDYVLVVNSNSIQTNTASAKGTLKITSATNLPNLTDVSSVALTDTGGTPVLTMSVP